MITVELRGLRVFGRHGVHDHEKRDGQDFLFDIDLAVGDRGSSDDLADAVDYSAVARAVKQVSDDNSFDLLEALASAIADDLIERFHAEQVRVCVTKPGMRPGGLEGVAGVSVSKP